MRCCLQVCKIQNGVKSRFDTLIITMFSNWFTPNPETQDTTCPMYHHFISSQEFFYLILIPTMLYFIHFIAHIQKVNLFLILQNKCDKSFSTTTNTIKSILCCTKNTNPSIPLHYYSKPWYNDQINDITSTLRIGIQKQLALSQTYYQHNSLFKPVPVVPSMYTSKRAVVEETQPRENPNTTTNTNDRDRSRTRTSSDNTTNSSTSSKSSKSIKFVEHAPAIFHNLRMLYGVKDIDIAHAFDTLNDVVNTNNTYNSPTGQDDATPPTTTTDASETKTTKPTKTTKARSSTASDDQPEKSAGKSAAVFIKSTDARFLLKTLNEEEKTQLMKMLSKYYHHMKIYSKKTLLPWFLGCYTLYREGAGYAPMSVVMMSNVFTNGVVVDEQYDLKGSTVSRTVGEHSIGKKGVTYKDLDWVTFGHRIHLNNEKERKRILLQLTIDAELLETCHVMDYSLLVGVRRNNGISNEITKESSKSGNRYVGLLERRSKRNGDIHRCVRDRLHEEFQGGLHSPLEDSIYYIGVIDILQKWNTRKKAETTLKRIRHFSLDVEPKFSCVDPKTYKNRFVKFMYDGVFVRLEE